MNELMEFFSTYRIDWMQASLLALGVAGASGLVIKKVVGRKKKHWSESTHSENENIVPFSAPHATNYDSMITEEVNNFLMPKVAIDEPKDLEDKTEKEFKLEKPSVHSAVDIPDYHPPVTQFVAPDLKEYEVQPESIDVPPIEEIKKADSNEFNFLDSFDEISKLPVPLPFILNKPSEDNTIEFPTLSKEDAAPKVDKVSDSSFDLELPSLTTLYPQSPKVEKEVEPEPLPVEDLNPPEIIQQASQSEWRLELVEEPSVQPIAVENKTNEITFVPEFSNLEPQSPIVELIKPVETRGLKPTYYTGIPTLTDVIEEPSKPVVLPPVPSSISPPVVIEEAKIEEKFIPTVKPEIDEEKFEFTKKYHVLIEEALYFDSQNNKEYAMNSLVEAGKLIENIRVNFYLKIAMQSYKNAVVTNALPSIINQFYIIEKEKLMKEDAQKKQESDVAALKAKKLVQESVVEKKSTVLQINEAPKPVEIPPVPVPINPPVAVEKTVEEAFNSEPVLPEGIKPVSFEEAFVTSPEEVQQEVQSEAQELQAFVEEVESEPLEEVAPAPVVLTVEDDEPPVVFPAFVDPVEHDASEGLLSDPELSPVAEAIQQQIESTDTQLINDLPQEVNKLESENNDSKAPQEIEQTLEVTPFDVREESIPKVEPVVSDDTIQLENNSLELNTVEVINSSSSIDETNVEQNVSELVVHDATPVEVFESTVEISADPIPSVDNLMNNTQEAPLQSELLEIEEIHEQPVLEINNEVLPYQEIMANAVIEDSVNIESNSLKEVENEPDAFAKVVASLEQTSSWFKDNKPVVSEAPAPVEKKATIEDEFSDEETKNQFMGAFGHMFKAQAVSQGPNIVIPQKRKHTLWVNWMSTEGGKMNFKNDMIEVNAAWGTKSAIEDLHQQLQARVGSDNQFSVVSVFEAK